MEESNLSEQELGQESSISSDLSFMNSSDYALPAKPQAIDIYKNSVGNPVTGTNPAVKASGISNIDAINSIVNNSIKKSENAVNPYARMKTYTYNGDFDGANFKRYYNTKQFEELGFSPYRDNESLYNQNMTLGDEFVRAASQWPGLVKTGFMSGVRAWGTMFTNPLAPDLEGARDMQRYMAIGSSSKGGLGGFLTNTFLNSGYTVGIGADLLMEELGLAAVTAFSGGLAGEVTVPGMMAKAGLATRRLAGIGEASAKAVAMTKRGENVLGLSKAAKAENEATKTLKSLNGVSDMRSFWNTTTGSLTSKALNVLNPLENTVNFIKTADYATDYAKVAGTFGAFAKDMIMTKAAVSEAQLEGGMVKIDTTKDLIQEYRDTHGGADPMGADLENIENLASQASAKTALWNLPAIMWSNKFMYEAMLAPINKMVKSNSSKLVDDIIFDNKSFRAVGDGYFEKTKLAFKALSKPKVYGKYGFDYLKANFAEGIQENLQEAISKGASEQAMAVFKDPTRADYEGYMGHFMKGLGEQFSAQGAETFAGGFVMGMFAQPVMSGPAWAISKGLNLTVNKERARAAKEERDRLLKQDVDTLNEFYQNHINYLAPDLQSATTGNGLSNDLYAAAAKGDQMGARNAKEAATFHHVHTALRTGKFDIFLNKLKEYKGFSPAEAKEAFQEYGIEDGDKALKYIDKIIDRSETIRNNYENAANEYPNPFRPNSYKAGTPLHEAHLTSYNAWEEAKKNLIFAKTSMQTHSERVEQMAQTFSKFGDNVAQSDAQTFMSLLDPAKTVNEINTLKKEIAVLDPKNPEQQPLIAEKKEILNLLNNFYNAIAANKFALSENNLARTDKKAKEKFAKIIEYLGKKNKSFVYNKSTEEAYQLIKDSMQLKDEMQGLTNSINVLSNPTGFLSMQKRLEEVYSTAIKQKADILQFNKRQFITRKEINTTLNILQEKHGLGITPEFGVALRESIASDTPIPIPTSFIDLQTDLPVDESDARFKDAVALWEDRIEFIDNKKEKEEKKEEAPGETKEEKKEETKAPETKSSKFDRKDFSTYPEDLKKLIQDAFDKAKKGEFPIEEDTVEEYALNNVFVEGIVDKYFAKKEDVEEGKEVPDEYSGLSVEELKAKIEELDLKDDKTKEDFDLLDKLDKALGYKLAEDTLSNAQKATLEKIKFLSSKTRKKNDDQSGYNINGTNYNLRVTKLVDRILEKDFKLNQFNFSGKDEGKVMIKIFNELKENKDLDTKDKKKYADAIIDGVFKRLNDEDKPHLKKTANRFNDRKIQAIKDGLKDDISEENFMKLIEKYAHEEANIRGNTADDIVRAYFNNETVTRPAGIEKEPFDNLIKILENIKAGIKERKEHIISKSLILSGEYSVEGKDEKVAGEMDLLVIDNDGNFKIYDLKTSDNWNYYGTQEDNVGKYGWRKKYRYTLQLSLYKKLLEDSTGIKVKELALIPIETKEDKNGKITKLDSAFDTEGKNTGILYNDIVEKYLQPLGTKNEVPIEVEKKEIKVPKGKTETKTELKAKDLIGKSYTFDLDGDAGIIKVLNITPGNEVKYELSYAETPDETVIQVVSFKEFQDAINSEIYKEVEVEVEEEEEEVDTKKQKEEYAEIDKLFNKDNRGTYQSPKTPENKKYSDYSSKGWKIHIQFDLKDANRVAKFLLDNNLYFKVQTDAATYVNTVTNAGATIYVGGSDNTLDIINLLKSNLSDTLTNNKNSNTVDLLDGGKPIYSGSGSDIAMSDGIAIRFDVQKSEFGTLKGNKKYESYGFASYLGNFSGISFLSKDTKKIRSLEEVLETKSSQEEKIKALQELEKLHIESLKELEKDFGKDFVGIDKIINARKGKPEEGPTPLSADEFNALSVKDKFNTVIDSIGDTTIQGVLEPIAVPTGRQVPSRDWGYQLRLKDGKTLRISYATKTEKDGKIPVGEIFTINKERYTYQKDGKVITEDILAVKQGDKLITNIAKEFDIFEKQVEKEIKDKEEADTLEELNKDINKNSLKIAKEKEYEVEYESLDNPEKSGNYNISKITKNFVYLTHPAMGEIKVPVNIISSTIKAIVKPGKKKFTKEDQDKLKENKAVVNTSDVSFDDKLTEDQTSSNLKDNIC